MEMSADSTGSDQKRSFIGRNIATYLVVPKKRARDRTR